MSVQQTPFFHYHVALGAKMADFASYEMPIYYQSIKQECLAVRTTAGLFDVSHMGEFIIKGPKANEFLSYLTPNNVQKISNGKAQYSALLNEKGAFIDDILIYGLEVPETYMLVVNASNRSKDATWIKQHLPSHLSFEDISDDTCLLALQGPRSSLILKNLCTEDLDKIPYYSFVRASLAGIDNVLISATGYTGEKGFELYFHRKHASELWQALMDEGEPHQMLPAGLGARDALRIEKGYSLYGHEIDETINPVDAQLQWIVKNPNDFIGKTALQGYTSEKVKVGFVIEGRGISRAGYPALGEQGEPIGTVTSSTLSPSLEKVVGMAYLPKAYTKEHPHFFVDARGTKLHAQIHPLPFL